MDKERKQELIRAKETQVNITTGRLRRYKKQLKKLKAIKIGRKKRRTKCAVVGCNTMAKAHCLCEYHYYNK